MRLRGRGLDKGGAGGSAQLSGWGAGGGGGGGAKSARTLPAARAGAGAEWEQLPESQPVLPGAGAGGQALPEPSRAELTAWHRPELGPACQPLGLVTVGSSEPQSLGTTRLGSLDRPCQAWAQPEHAELGIWTEEAKERRFHLRIVRALGGEKSEGFTRHGAEEPGAY